MLRTEETPTYIAYTDSGYHICRDGGAYAYILLKDGEIIRKEAFLFRHESNNRGELHAIIAPTAATSTTRCATTSAARRPTCLCGNKLLSL